MITFYVYSSSWASGAPLGTEVLEKFFPGRAVLGEQKENERCQPLTISLSKMELAQFIIDCPYSILIYGSGTENRGMAFDKAGKLFQQR